MRRHNSPVLLEWRQWTQFVALVDFIFTCSIFWLAYNLFIFSIRLTFELDFNLFFPLSLCFVLSCWLLLLGILLVILIQLVADSKLYKSTLVRRLDPISASKLAKFWRAVSITFVLLIFACIAIGGRVRPLIASNLIFRILSLIIVQMYINYLEDWQMPPLPLSNNPTEVIIYCQPSVRTSGVVISPGHGSGVIRGASLYPQLVSHHPGIVGASYKLQCEPEGERLRSSSEHFAKLIIKK